MIFLPPSSLRNFVISTLVLTSSVTLTASGPTNRQKKRATGALQSHRVIAYLRRNSNSAQQSSRLLNTNTVSDQSQSQTGDEFVIPSDNLLLNFKETVREETEATTRSSDGSGSGTTGPAESESGECDTRVFKTMGALIVSCRS